MINCETELDLPWSKECIISKILLTPRVPAISDDNPPVQEVAAIQATGATFQVKNAKRYVPVVKLSINDNIKQGFKITISSNRYSSKLTTQTKNNNLDYLIDPTFRNINRFFVLSFKNGNDNPKRDSFDEYYMPLIELNILMH